MSQSGPGAIAINLHEGSRSEYLAQYAFASMGTVIAIPHQEDSGIDLFCTLVERIGKRAWPQYYFAVQVKSTMKPWTFKSRESIEWLIRNPFPVLLCAVDKKNLRLRVYHTMPRFYVWSRPSLPETLVLIPEKTTEGTCSQWIDGERFSLSAHHP